MAHVRRLRREFVVAAHNAQLREHGGAYGVRDEGLLDSALARPVNLDAYEEVSLHRLAASYLFGIARNHPFVDGNKPVAFAAAESFLILNGIELDADQLEKYEMMIQVASGEMTEKAIANWFKNRST